MRLEGSKTDKTHIKSLYFTNALKMIMGKFKN